jgi:hypothetical protein
MDETNVTSDTSNLTGVTISLKISVATRKRLEEAIETGIIDENSLNSFLKNKENRVTRKERKLLKKNGLQDKAKANQLKTFKPEVLISLPASKKIWGEELATKENKINISESSKIILKNPKFNFFTALLNGLSIRQMVGKYPELIVLPKTKTKDFFDLVSNPGYYFISLKNELVNLSPADEKEKWPDDFYQLDINLMVELLLCFLVLGREVPNIFFKTSYGLNGKELCVKIEQGKIIFRSSGKLNGDSVGLCLYNNQTWMESWVETKRGDKTE